MKKYLKTRNGQSSMNENEQMDFWRGRFGDEYIERNSDDFDESFKKKFGITRTLLNKQFLSKLDRNTRILEVGCNIGKQLSLLNAIGFDNLWGIEINKKALDIAKQNKNINVIFGSATDIPFKDGFFDLVFTSGVLIHIPPDSLDTVMSEMHRATGRYIWGFEYFSEKLEEIEYRGNKNKLWKNDFSSLFLSKFSDLSLVKSEKIKYIGSDNVDAMYLLKKA